MVQDDVPVFARRAFLRHAVALGTTFSADSLAHPLLFSTDLFAVVQTQAVTTCNIVTHIVKQRRIVKAVSMKRIGVFCSFSV